MVEGVPFFALNFWLCREVGMSPCIAGASMIVYGVARIFYSKAYAFDGPGARAPAFMVATMASMTCLGVGIASAIKSFI